MVYDVFRGKGYHFSRQPQPLHVQHNTHTTPHKQHTQLLPDLLALLRPPPPSSHPPHPPTQRRALLLLVHSATSSPPALEALGLGHLNTLLPALLALLETPSVGITEIQHLSLQALITLAAALRDRFLPFALAARRAVAAFARRLRSPQHDHHPTSATAPAALGFLGGAVAAAPADAAAAEAAAAAAEQYLLTLDGVLGKVLRRRPLGPR